MYIFFRPFSDPFLNLAAEEYYIKQATQDICMLWINERSVIIGKHQNAYAEINHSFLKNNQIPVIRRISGGGAVYHDRGNLNFSFISSAKNDNQADFKRFTSVIISFMQSLGIQVTSSKRNSLFIGDEKFSGHAEHLFHNKILHHGTILFNSDLTALNNSITPAGVYDSKAMASVRSKVLNVAPLLPFGVDIMLFVEVFIKWLHDFFPGSSYYNPKPIELEEIQLLAEKKYRTWEWNFGYSPAYSFKIQLQSGYDLINANVRVVNGIISSVELISSSGSNKLPRIFSNLAGILHKEEEITRFIENNRELFELDDINTVSFKAEFIR